MATIISFDEYLEGCSPLSVMQLRMLSEVDVNLYNAIEVATKQSLAEMDKEEVAHLMSQYEERITH